jgi:hypothetical protein
MAALSFLLDSWTPPIFEAHKSVHNRQTKTISSTDTRESLAHLEKSFTLLLLFHTASVDYLSVKLRVFLTFGIKSLIFFQQCCYKKLIIAYPLLYPIRHGPFYFCGRLHIDFCSSKLPTTADCFVFDKEFANLV